MHLVLPLKLGVTVVPKTEKEIHLFLCGSCKKTKKICLFLEVRQNRQVI
jgi:hypothetical protein